MGTIAFFLLTRLHAAPSTLEHEYLQKLNRAGNKTSIEKLQARFDHIRVLRMACRLQLQAHQVPVSCYETLQAEAEWGLHSESQAVPLEIELDERCRKAAAQLRLPARHESLSALSKSCLAQVEEARRIEHYRAPEPAAWSEN